MKKKLFAISLCLLLLISGTLVAAGDEATNREKINENDISEDQEAEEHLKERTKERVDEKEDPLYENKREFVSDAYDHTDGDMLIDEEVYPREKSVKSSSREYSGNISFESIKDDYETHDPIRIDSDEDFAQKADDENWSGNGSESNPYIIEGYEIDGVGHGYSLYIGNVTDHFEVNGCYLHNASGGEGEYFSNSGLYLDNTSNGDIQDNLVSNNSQEGILLDHTTDDTLFNNTVYSNDGHEILLQGSDDNEVVNNQVYGNISSSEESNSQDGVEYRSDSILVQLKSPEEEMVKRWGEESALKLKTDEIANTVDGLTSRTYPSFNMAEISLDKEIEIKRAVESLSRMEEVITAEPNYLMNFQGVPNDPGYDSLWGMPTIDAPEAWDTTTGSEEVVVAVVDSGVDYNHPDLEDNMWTSEDGHHGYNAVNNSYYPKDDVGHGTHVAGTIGAVGDNDQGVVGVNWNVSVMGIKVGDSTGITMANAIAGLEYVLERKREGENIIATSNSWGGVGYSELLYEAIEQHQEEGISFVAAAGNAGTDADETSFYPANYDLTNIVSVAATDGDDELARFSNYGERSVHVGAPGVDINSTLRNGEYGPASGTSMAAPHVSGLMALLASHNTSYNHNQLKNVILSSVDRLQSLENLTLTEGRINAHRALELSPDPDNIRFWTHRPTSKASWGESSPISISLNDGVNPILGANVSVEFSTGINPVYLEDDGSRGDQAGDGYYTGEWTPRTLGEVNLTITAKLEDDLNITKNLTVDISGDSDITLVGSDSNVLSGNNLTANYYGISLYTSEYNELTENLVRNNTYAGISLHESNNNELVGLNVSNSEYGLLLEGCDENSIFNNIISNTYMGIMIRHSRGNRLSNNNVSNNVLGVIFENSRENKIIENDVFDNGFYGMIYYQSSNNTIENNFIEKNSFYGISLLGTKDHSLSENSISNSIYGIYLSDVDSANIDNNQLEKNRIGISLTDSKKVTLSENKMIDCGIYIDGLSKEYWNTHSIDPSNTVNGDPVYYWKNKNGGTVPTDAGQVILSNCEEVRVKDQDISDGSVGILAGFSSNSTFKENRVINTSWEGITLVKSDGNILENNLASETEYPGFFLFESSDNKIIGNTAEQNGFGLFIALSTNNTLTDNKLVDNSGGLILVLSHRNILRENNIRDNQLGIGLSESDENTLMENMISNHDDVGIDIIDSSENLVYRNRFIENEEQALDNGDNKWDAGDPTEDGDGGNYWSDYEGEDRGDGIGREPYQINNHSQDNYPWMTEEMALGEEDENILDTILNIIDIRPYLPDLSNLPDLPEIPNQPDTPERRDIPGFSFLLLVFGLVFAVTIHHKKER
ncbi:MAG: NosD domain-containing protein [Candidatus Thermoplasmatota archaeon]